MKQYSHIIWDFNGTLIDDLDIAVSINCQMNLDRGRPQVDRQFYLDHFTHPPIRFYEAMGYTFQEEPYEEVSRDFIRRYTQRQGEAKLNPGVPQALEAFRRAGLPQMILSAHTQKLLRAQVEELGIGRYFCHIIGTQDQVVTGKVERALAFAREEGLDLGRALLIGDTTHDFETAQALGCSCALCALGHQSRAQLAATGVRVYDSLEELVGEVTGE